MTSPTPDAEERDTKRDELIFDLIKRRYDSELNRLTALDGKAGNIIGFVSVVIGLLVGVGMLEVPGKLSKLEYFIVYLIGIGFILLSIILSLYALRIRRWNFVPNVLTLRRKYFDVPYRLALRKNATTMAQATENIEKENNSKARAIQKGWFFLIGGLTIIFMFLIISTTAELIWVPK